MILYPVSRKIFNGNIESMGVINYGMRYFDISCNCVELTVPFLRSYGNCDCENSNFDMRLREDRKILDEILRNFEKVESKVKDA